MKVRQTPYLNFKNKISTLKEELATDVRPNAVILHSEHQYCNFKALKLLRTMFAKSGFDYQLLDPALTSVETIYQLWEQQSLFQQRTLYSIPNCDKYPKLTDAIYDACSKYQSVNCLCVTFNVKTLPSRLKKLREQSNVVAIQTAEPYQSELPNYIKDEASQLKMKVDLKACRALIESQGNNLFKIDNELAKLSFLLTPQDGKTSLVSPTDIQNYIPKNRLDSLFELDNLLLRKNYALAIEHAIKLLSSGESILSIISVIANHCRKTLKIMDVRAGASTQAIANKTNIPAWLVSKYVTYAQTMSKTTISKVLHNCYRADTELKSSNISGDLLASEAIMQFVE